MKRELLSRQKESKLDVRSPEPEFSFEEEELIWTHLSSEVTELTFYWSASSNLSTSEKRAVS